MHSVPSGQSVEDHGYALQDRAPQLRTRTPGLPPASHHLPSRTSMGVGLSHPRPDADCLCLTAQVQPRLAGGPLPQGRKYWAAAGRRQ